MLRSSPVSTAVAQGLGLSKGSASTAVRIRTESGPPTFVDGLQETDCVFALKEIRVQGAPLGWRDQVLLLQSQKDGICTSGESTSPELRQ
jgi:hypothetical protein